MKDQNLEKNILFLDIETVPVEANYQSLNERWKKLWDRKAQRLSKNGETAEELYPRAGIYAEFGKIICICAGRFQGKNFVLESFYGKDEHQLLSDFAQFLNNQFNKPEHRLCAHNGIEFDFPYIARRMLINSIALPSILDHRAKKPWEVQHLDTMQLWKFGDFKAYTSLDLLCAVFDIPTPKNDIDGSMVHKVYYEDGDLERITEYCRKDTISVAQLYRKYYAKAFIEPEQIIIPEQLA